jgi:PAS domain-containing protein
MHRRAHTYDSLAPRVDPVMDASYKNYWAFHNPLWTLSTTRASGEVFCLDSLIRRADFTATNEWYRPAEFGLAMMAANLFIGDEVSALIGVANVPGNDEIMREQMRVFKAALPHIDRSVRIHCELRIRDFDHDTAPDRLENLQRSVLLVDGAARVLFANAAARRLLGSGGGLVIKGGSLHSTGDFDAIQGLIASCTRKGQTPNGHGGEISVRRRPHNSPLRVTVTPLRSKGTVAELPWLALWIFPWPLSPSPIRPGKNGCNNRPRVTRWLKGAGRAPWLSSARRADGCKFASLKYRRVRAILALCVNRRHFAKDDWRRHAGAHADLSAR